MEDIKRVEMGVFREPKIKKKKVLFSIVMFVSSNSVCFFYVSAKNMFLNVVFDKLCLRCFV